jgi:23S rRNA (cytosine1962-C5)-methyltransferase
VHAQRWYELIDLGGGARLERFGDRVVDRPHPGALGARGDPGRWLEAALRFDRERGWTGRAVSDGPWEIELDGLTMELRPTEAGQIGLFPEHLAMVPWLEDRVAERLSVTAAAPQPEPAPGPAPSPPAVLNLFAYTGLATLVMARSGAAVTHVDSARPAVAWARHNAGRSGLADRPIRWIVDDAVAFTRREARRDRRYAGVALDPPSYGHGPGGRSWRLEDDLPRLLDAVHAVLEPDGFLLLTAHTPGYDGDRLATMLRQASAGRTPATALEHGPLRLTTADGRDLELGAFARRPGGA